MSRQCAWRVHLSGQYYKRLGRGLGACVAAWPGTAEEAEMAACDKWAAAAYSGNAGIEEDRAYGHHAQRIAFAIVLCRVKSAANYREKPDAACAYGTANRAMPGARVSSG